MFSAYIFSWFESKARHSVDLEWSVGWRDSRIGTGNSIENCQTKQRTDNSDTTFLIYVSVAQLVEHQTHILKV